MGRVVEISIYLDKIVVILGICRLSAITWICIYLCRHFVTDLYSLSFFIVTWKCSQKFCMHEHKPFNAFSCLKCTVEITCNWKYCYEIFKSYMQRDILFMQSYIVFRKYIWRIHCVTVNRPRIWTVGKFETLYITQNVHVRLHVMLL